MPDGIEGHFVRAQVLLSRCGVPKAAAHAWLEVADRPWLTCLLCVSSGWAMEGLIFAMYAANADMSAVTIAILIIGTGSGFLATCGFWFVGQHCSDTVVHKALVAVFTLSTLYLLVWPFVRMDEYIPFQNRFTYSCIVCAGPSGKHEFADVRS